MSLSDYEILTYPRGFKGLYLGHRPKIKRNNSQYKLTAVGGIGFPDPTVIKKEPYNEEIQNAYLDFINGKPGTLGFDFRETVLELVLQTFDNGKFGVTDFVYLQKDNGKISRFIEDTFKYIITGEREVMLETWSAIIKESDMVEIDYRDADYTLQFLHSGSNSPADLIQQWCSKQNGFADMLMTMQILYGAE